MERKAVAGIMLVMLLTSMSTMVFNAAPIMAHPSVVRVPDYPTIRESDKGSVSNQVGFHNSCWYDDSKNQFDRDESAGGNQSPRSVAEGKSDFNKTNEWADFASVHGDLAELVVGVNETRAECYDELMDVVTRSGGKIVNKVSMGGEIEAVVAGIPFVSVSSFMTEVRAAGLSRYIEPNMRFEAKFVPNDPYWIQQWAPKKIEADFAWNSTIGDLGVLVAVIDTGVDWDHPDLAANYVPLGYDWVNNDTDPMDDHGHGTHCAGIIAAILNNGIGIAGLAQVRIMAEKGLNEYGEGYEDDLANAIIHAVDQGADILSNSWGGYGESVLIREAIRYAYDNGVLVVAAAGNEAIDFNLYPAGYHEVVAVTATDQNDRAASFSNFGEWIELAAPGVHIYSTVWDNSYTYMGGTSMAVPHVAGVAALIWSRFPNATRDWVRIRLQSTADDLGDPGFDVYFGYGRVNARRAVEQAPREHELVISGWEIPSCVEPGSSVYVNTTVFNFGTSNESALVYLSVNGMLVDSVFIDSLPAGTSFTVSCTWRPRVEGMYKVVSYVFRTCDEIIENNFVSAYVYVGFPLKALVLDSAGTDLVDVIISWQVLSSNWHKFGSRMIRIDYESLNIDDITYDDIVATDADVLIISCACDPRMGWEFTDSEIDAIARYVHEGHGLIATAGTLYYEVPNNNKLAPLFGLNETIKWYGTSTDLLRILKPTHPLFVDVPNPFVTETVPAVVSFDGQWDSNELAGGTYLALGHYLESAIVAYRGTVCISPWLEVIPCYYYFHLQLLYNAITWSRYQKPEHELVVFLDCPRYLESGDSAILNATVSNMGLNDEISVELFLLVNGTAVNSTMIPELLRDSSCTITYLWTPTVEATYNVTAYAPPVPDEAVLINNVASIIVRVCIRVEVLYDESHDNRNFLDRLDPINHGDAWGYTTWAKIVTEAGYRITKWLPGDGELTLSVLLHYDILVISMARESFTVSEISAIQTWVDSGGSLFLVGEAYNYGGDPERLNAIIKEFGMEFDLYGEIYDYVITDLAVHPVTRGLSQYEVAYCGVLVLSPPAQ